jgi:low temperature requirement protein LtrA
VGPAAAAPAGGVALRVTTIELFFDLVFAFTLTQLTTLLSDDASLASAVQVLLIFALIWWMYAGYAWLTNTRPPSGAAERLPLLIGMGGLLIAGLAIPEGFGRNGVVLGLGYLVLVLVHAWLYQRVNRNIIRVAPFNIAAALLVTAAA